MKHSRAWTKKIRANQVALCTEARASDKARCPTRYRCRLAHFCRRGKALPSHKHDPVYGAGGLTTRSSVKAVSTRSARVPVLPLCVCVKVAYVAKVAKVASWHWTRPSHAWLLTILQVHCPLVRLPSETCVRHRVCEALIHPASLRWHQYGLCVGETNSPTPRPASTANLDQRIGPPAGQSLPRTRACPRANVQHSIGQKSLSSRHRNEGL